jgi:RNA polymerase primary sigma factor
MMKQFKINKKFTKRDEVSLEKYLQEISKIKLLDVENEVLLFRRIRQGDREALNTLIKANLRFVISVSKQYQNRGLSLPDLINEGNVGLIKAAHRFDETRGFKFISYAVWWIRQSILQALAENSRIVRIPVNKVGSIEKITDAFNKLEQEYQREPTVEEVADLIGITPDLIENSVNYSNVEVSFDAPIKDEEAINMYDMFENEDSPSPDEELISNSLSAEIERMFSTLSKRDADIMRHYYGLNGFLPQSMEVIADEFGLSCERVRQIIKNSKRKLKKQRYSEKVYYEYA